MGSAATLGAALWISWQLGLAAQGEFGLAKSWFDAAAAWACLGAPQGLLHMQYREDVPAAALKAWIRRFVGWLGAGAVVLAVALWIGGWRLPALVAAAVPFAVAHLISRSLILPQQGPVRFGFATAVPALFTLAGVALFIALNHGTDFDALLLAASMLGALVTVKMAWPSGARPLVLQWSTRTLWQVSLQSWLQQALAAALAAALLSTVAASGRGPVALGEAALSLQLYQVFVVLAAYASPLIYDRAARATGRHQPVPAVSPRWMLGAAVCAAIAIVVAGWAWQTDVAAATSLLSWGLAVPAGCAAVAARLGATILLARGRYAELSAQALCRLVLGISMLWFVSQLVPASAAVALTLLVLETLTWWRCRRVIDDPRRAAATPPP